MSIPAIVTKNKSVSEIIEFVREHGTNNELKVKLLKKLSTRGLEWIVQTMYTRDFSKYPIPSGIQFNHRDKVICHATIQNSINRIESAIRIYDSKPQKYNDLMTLVLEELPEDDAKLLIDIFSGKKIEGISKAVWKRVYPQFFRT